MCQVCSIAVGASGCLRLGLKVEVFGFRVSGFGSSGFGFRISSFGFRVSGFELRVEVKRQNSMARKGFNPGVLAARSHAKKPPVERNCPPPPFLSLLRASRVRVQCVVRRV